MTANLTINEEFIFMTSFVTPPIINNPLDIASFLKYKTRNIKFHKHKICTFRGMFPKTTTGASQ